jgi:hypothetical protein
VYLPREDTARHHSRSRAADSASGRLLPALAAAAAAVSQPLVFAAVAVAVAKCLLHALAAAAAWLSLVRSTDAAAFCLVHVLAAAARAQCLLHALAAAAAWLLLVRATAAATVCLFHVLAAETPAKGSRRQHRCRMGEWFWLVLDAADVAAAAEVGSNATTIDKGVPPASAQLQYASRCLAPGWGLDGGPPPPLPAALSRRRSPTHTFPHSPLPASPPPPLLSHSPPIPHRHTVTPRGRSYTPGFPGDRFSSLGGTGGLHSRYTRTYIHAAHTIHVPPYSPQP